MDKRKTAHKEFQELMFGWQPESNGVRPIYDYRVDQNVLKVFFDNLMLGLLEESEPKVVADKLKAYLDGGLNLVQEHFQKLADEGVLREEDLKVVQNLRKYWVVLFEVGDAPVYRLGR